MPDSPIESEAAVRGAERGESASAGSPAGALPYASEPLAALLSVFSRWGSGGFIQAVAETAELPQFSSVADAQPAAQLDATSIIAITMLAREGAMRPSALAEHLRVGASNVSKISARLVEAGLLDKITDPGDSRASILQLTPAGEAVMASLVEAGDRMMASILSDWSHADRTELARLLQRFEQDAARHALSPS